jgi:Golgi phosphoprotein 3
MLIELALRGRLQLEACGMRRKGLLTRKVRFLNKILFKEFELLKMKNVSF